MFKNGGEYHYENVSPEAYAALEKADSVGSHFHAHIKNMHQFKKIEKRGRR